MSGVEARWPIAVGLSVPNQIAGRAPDCPDCGAQVQVASFGGRSMFRCPWATEARWLLGITAGVMVVSCDHPLDGDRDPYPGMRGRKLDG